MKKRFLPVATAISAAFLLAACSETDVVDLSPTQAGNAADNAVTFSTYTAKKGTTRAGYAGNMTDATLKQKYKDERGNVIGGGFGVFAYYTGLKTYGEYQAATYGTGTTSDAEGEKKDNYPNFMYNQLVEYTGDVMEGDELITTNWTYSPLKYWPNDFNEGAVDQQNPPAEGSGTNGGKVSFFAYAPYVATKSATEWPSETSGITGMTANSTAGDPKIEYTLGATGTDGKFVDLLWGTLGSGTGSNVLGHGNIGVSHGSESSYQQAILKGNKEGEYTVAADLEKQYVNGQVKFNFKHALAGIGGSTEAVDPDYEDEDVPKKSGFYVQLDIDGSKKGETTDEINGGKREEFLKDNQEGVQKKYYRTIVTIKKVTIESVPFVGEDKDGNGEIEENEKEVTGGELYKTGTLNLATGRWDIGKNIAGDAAGDNYKVDQTIGTGETAETGGVSYELNTNIAEYKSKNTSYFPFSYTNALPEEDQKWAILDYFKKFSNKHTGVTEDKLNVYQDPDVSPILLFPGSKPIFKICVEYVVRQYDDALALTYTEVTNKITKAVIFPEVKLNTHYTLVMHLGLTSVKFTAEVSGWTKYDKNSDEPGDEDPDGRNEYVTDLDQIVLPSNEFSQPTSSSGEDEQQP